MDRRMFETLTTVPAAGIRRAIHLRRGRGLLALALAAAVALPGTVAAFDGADLPVTPTAVATGVPAAAALPAVGSDGGPLPTATATAAPGVGGDAPDEPTPGATGADADADAGTVPTVIAGEAAPTSSPSPSPGTTATPATPATGGPTTPAVQVPPDLALSTRIYEGLCDQLGPDPVFQLIEAGAGGAATTPEGEPAPPGQPSAIPVRASSSVVDTTVNELLASPYAVDVRLNPTDPASSIACGDIGGLLDEQLGTPQLAIGLGPRNGSGFAGIAAFRDEGERVLVSVFIAPLAGAPIGPAVPTTSDGAAAASTAEAAVAGAAVATPGINFAAGDTVVTTDDINLRAAASTEAAIVAILGTGVPLDVTGAAADGWLPVRDASTGRRGYVTLDFVEAS